MADGRPGPLPAHTRPSQIRRHAPPHSPLRLHLGRPASTRPMLPLSPHTVPCPLILSCHPANAARSRVSRPFVACSRLCGRSLVQSPLQPIPSLLPSTIPIRPGSRSLASYYLSHPYAHIT
ncbi:hypothetical protein C8Q76DRAFT_734232 [Earliella scabrosa]|nr:hypothetical protein C8Q76DRAFT_734232 [Earliella scabrosa]